MAIRKDDERNFGKAVATREHQQRRLEQLLKEADKLLDRLKVEWEKYFLGIETMPPEPLMRDAQRAFIEIEKNRVMKTALKWRVQVVKDRWTSLKLYWMRNQRQIENGTHFRLKRKLSIKEKDQALADRVGSIPDAAAAPIHAEDEATQASSVVSPPAPTRAAAAPPPAGGGPPAHSPGSNELFKDFIMARASCGQSVQGITPEKLSQQLSAQANAIRAKTGKNVHFRVVVEDGKPKVKAVPI